MPMSNNRYRIHDAQEHISSMLRPKNTWLNPRYFIVDNETNQIVDESTSKRALQLTLRLMNSEAS